MTESEEFEQRLRLRAKALFRQQEQSLDEETCAALRQARARAVAASAAPRTPRRIRRLAWGLPVGVAASLLALAVLLIPDADFAGPPDAMHAVAVTDVALLLAGDDWALYEDMDFFAVLGALDDEDAEPGSS